MQKIALSVKELAKELGVGKNFAYQLVKSKGFPAIKLNKRIIIPREGLNRWLQENEGKNFANKNEKPGSDRE